MNIVQKAINDAKRVIPKEVLTQAFVATTHGYFGLNKPVVNIDERLRTLVLHARVLPDCNVVGGVESVISLEGLPVTKSVENEALSVVHIPKERTDGRTIISCETVSFLPNYLQANPTGIGLIGTNFTGSGSQYTAGMGVAQTLLASWDRIPWIGVVARLIGENTIAYADTLRLTYTGYVKVLLENESNLSNIPLTASLYFSKLFVYAVQAHIYTTLVIALDQGQLQGGFEIGAMKSVVDSYADANDKYEEYLATTWRKVAFQSDDSRMTSFIKGNIGAGY